MLASRSVALGRSLLARLLGSIVSANNAGKHFPAQQIKAVSACGPSEEDGRNEIADSGDFRHQRPHIGAAVRRSFPSALQGAISGQFSLVLSLPILDQSTGVFQHSKFGLPQESVDLMVGELEARASIVYPAIGRAAVERDPTDNMIVERAIVGHAEFIVSGDNHLLSLRHLEEILVVTRNAYTRYFTARPGGVLRTALQQS